jgi:ABC-type oligopeptide transport system ATPase subunit
MQLGVVKGRDALRVRCEELATMVGLPHNLLDRFPHQLSGGQKARVGIARAIALHPKLVILDEPTAALDVSVQAVVLNLLQDLKARLGMSYLFVSHDLNVVRLLCDRVIVMRTGRIVEEGSSEQVLSDPKDDYTKELLTAIPHPPLPVHESGRERDGRAAGRIHRRRSESAGAAGRRGLAARGARQSRSLAAARPPRRRIRAAGRDRAGADLHGLMLP